MSKRKYFLRVDEWPHADRAAFEAAIAPAGPLDAAKPASLWPPSTLDIRRAAYSSFLTFLARRGTLDMHAEAGAQVTPEAVGAWAAERLRSSRPITVDTGFHGLTMMLRAMLPSHDWRWIARHPARPSAATRRAARKPVEPLDAGLLLVRARKHARRLDREPPSSARGVAGRDLALVVLAALVAPRIDNLAKIQLGKHLEPVGESFRLSFKGGETKNRRPLMTLVPDIALPLLRRYLDVWRAEIVKDRPDPGTLWVARRGGGLSTQGAYYAFRRTTRLLLGCAVYPHVVRHTVATGLMRTNPRDPAKVAAALGHRGLRTMMGSYDHSRTEGALREWRALKRRVAKGRKP